MTMVKIGDVNSDLLNIKGDWGYEAYEISMNIYQQYWVLSIGKLILVH